MVIFCSALVLLAHPFFSTATFSQDTLNGDGIVTIPSHHSVSETLDRLETALQSRGLKIFARIDFAEDAETVGFSMHASQLLIFGNPRAGTPLILAEPTAAIDLPLKVLCWEDADGTVWLSYNSPSYLQNRHGLPEELMAKVSGFPGLIEEAAK